MPRFTTPALILALVSASAPGARPARGGDPQPVASVELSGHWTYNVQLSDDARQKMREEAELHPDGKKYKTDNGTAEIRSYWKDARLVVETKRTGGTTVETWERVPDGSRLIVNLRLEGGVGPKLELKRIYDRAPAAAEAPGK